MPKVLHVVEALDRGAVESWLLRMRAHARRRGDDVDWSFYCTLVGPGSRDCEASALGARVVHSPVQISEKLAFAGALRAELRRGRYDVLHCHHDLISGVYLAAAAGLPIATRLVHTHNADESVLTPSLLKQAVLKPGLRRVCLTQADMLVGNSEHSLRTMLGGHRLDPARHRVNYYGIDPGPFAAKTSDSTALRLQLGVAPDAPILLFAGRMTPEKNPVYAVDVLAALRRRLPEAVGVFAGAGDLEAAVRARADQLGHSNAVRLLGWRDDVAAIMRASDWFILPRPHTPVEGFGIAVVEAQLAGLRLLLSLGVSDAPILPGAAWRRLSLDDGPESWANAAAELWRGPAPSQDAALLALRASPMDMDRALDDLLALHATAGR